MYSLNCTDYSTSAECNEHKQSDKGNCRWTTKKVPPCWKARAYNKKVQKQSTSNSSPKGKQKQSPKKTSPKIVSSSKVPKSLLLKKLSLQKHSPQKQSKKPLVQKQILVVCHGRKHQMIYNLDYKNAFFVEPDKKNQPDLVGEFPSKEFQNTVKNHKFKQALFVTCPVCIMINLPAFEGYVEGKAEQLKPDFWIQLNKYLQIEGLVYILGPVCSRLHQNIIWSNFEKALKDQLPLYGFKYDRCGETPYTKTARNTGLILHKTRELGHKQSRKIQMQFYRPLYPLPALPEKHLQKSPKNKSPIQRSPKNKSPIQSPVCIIPQNIKVN